METAVTILEGRVLLKSTLWSFCNFLRKVVITTNIVHYSNSCYFRKLLLSESLIAFFFFQSLQVFRDLLSAIPPEATTWRCPGYTPLEILIIMKWSSRTTMISSKQKVSQRMKMNVCSLIWSQGGSTVSRSAQRAGNTKLVKGSMAEQVSKYPGNILRHSRIFFYLPVLKNLVWF